MKTTFRLLFIVSILMALLAGSVSSDSSFAGTTSYTRVELAPAWTTGILSDGVGPSGISAADFDQDGKGEVATCSSGYAYVLNYLDDGSYDTEWYSENLGCRKIVTGDRDSDGTAELYIGTDDAKLYIIESGTYSTLATHALAGGVWPDGIAVGDVDDDDSVEIVVTTSISTTVYDAFTFAIKWQSSWGGNQVDIGNIDADPVNEIVVNGETGHILNALTQQQEWAYIGGFGISMDLGDVDGDGLQEIGFIEPWYDAYVLEGDSQTIRWHRSDLSDLEDVAVADTDGDGLCEVIIGDGQWGYVTGYRGSDGSYLWAIQNPEHGVFGIGAGDTDNDGIPEIIWGSGLSSSGKDSLYIGSWDTQTVDWGSDDLDGPLFVASGDIDLDGQGELVMASESTDSGYVGGTLRVYDGLSHRIEWSTQVSNSFFDLSELAVGQLDGDPALEFIAGGDNWYDTRLVSYDGITHAVEWNPIVMEGGGSPGPLLLHDIDADSIDEIIVVLSADKVQVFHGASNVIQWDSGTLDGAINDVSVGDVDANGIDDLAILTSASIHVFETAGWTEILNRSVTGGEVVAISEAGFDMNAGLVLINSLDGTDHTLQAWGGPDFSLQWQHSLGAVFISEMVSADLDHDGAQELVLLGSEGKNGSVRSVLWISSPAYPLFWEYRANANYGTIYSMAVSDLDGDGQDEFAFSGGHMFQVDKMTARVVDIHQVALPMVSRPCPVIFSDDFSDPASGWPSVDTGEALLAYTGGEYRMLLRPTGSGIGARPGIQATAYSVTVDVRNQDGRNGSYGIVFGLAQDWSSFYTLEIYPDGWFGIYRYSQGPVITLAEAYSPYINQGTATNEIRIIRNSPAIDAYANGNLLVSVNDSAYTGMRYLGLIVFSYDQPNVDARFDNYLVTPLGCNEKASKYDAFDAQVAPGYQLLYFAPLSKMSR